MRRVSGLSWGGLPGRLVVVGAGTLQLSLGVLGAGLKPGAGLLCRRDPGFQRRPQLGLVPRRGSPRGLNDVGLRARASRPWPRTTALCS